MITVCNRLKVSEKKIVFLFELEIRKASSPRENKEKTFASLERKSSEEKKNKLCKLRELNSL